MCYEEVACPRCSSLNVKKNGISAQYKQRFRCKECERQFITDYIYQAYKAGVRSLVLPMTMNGSGIRDISRVLSISTNTVLKKKVRASQCFKTFHAAERTIEGVEAMNMMRKGQVKRLAGSDVRGQVKFVESLFGIAA